MSSLIHPRLQNLYQYWLTIKNKRHMPAKADLDLHRIPSHLPCVFLIEWDPVNTVFTWRLTGTALYTLCGRELSTSPVLDLWEPGQRADITDTFQHVRTAFQPFCIRLRGFSSEGHELGLEMLTMPLLDTVSTNVLIFGGLVPFKTPLWLDRAPLQKLNAWEVIALDGCRPDRSITPAMAHVPISDLHIQEVKTH